MDSIYQLNIERAILSSILFNPIEIEVISAVIKHTDFYLPSHKKIFEVMENLHSEDMPIDEEFIRQRISKKELDDSILIEILSANAITNVLAYAKEIKDSSVKRELISLANEIQKTALDDIAPKKAIEHIKMQLDAITVNSSVSMDFKSITSKKSVTKQIIEDAENTKFLIEDLLIYNNITTFVGEPNVGKSAVSFAIANKLFHTKKIKHLLYFDADNSLGYVKSRILKLFNDFGDDNIDYYTGSTASENEMVNVLESLGFIKGGGEEVLIVIDSLQDFIVGSISDDTPVKFIYGILKRVRENFKATIIVLHHTKKSKDENGKLSYVGSQAIRSSTDTLTYVSRDEVSKQLLFENDKMRGLAPKQIAFELDFDNMELIGCDVPVDETEAQLKDNTNKVIELLKNNSAGMEIKALKNALKGNLKSKDIDKIVKDRKMFRMTKNSDDGWIIKLQDVVKFDSEPNITVFVGDDDKMSDDNFMEMF